MARWVVTCPECDTTFTYCVIERAILEQAYRDPYRVVPRPTLPDRGDNRTCPNCKIESAYLPFHLFYRQDERGEARAHSG